jgi:hypothetical protein
MPSGKQNSNYPDGKTFKSPPATPSTEFGQFTTEEGLSPGSDPGSKQIPAPKWSPEN